MYLPFIEKIGDYIFMEGRPVKSDIIFIPGNGYPQMAEQAARLWREGYAPFVLPSGRYSIGLDGFSGVLAKSGQYPGEFATEWEFLMYVLVRNGVSQQAILREDRATYTEQNAVYSRRVTDRLGISVERAILCCKNYHSRRAFLYYQMQYPEADFQVIPSCVDGVNRRNWNRTEAGVAAVTGEVNRIIRQFSLFV